jgi:hypothetical protein
MDGGEVEIFNGWWGHQPLKNFLAVGVFFLAVGVLTNR